MYKEDGLALLNVLYNSEPAQIMYKDYFRLTQLPFSIAPDPRFMYMSARHREALAHLLYGVQGEGGIVVLTGEIGTGKTTLCRCLLEQIHSQCDVAFILNPRMSVQELLCTICDEFRIEIPAGTASVKVAVDAINEHLLRANAQDRRAVLIIDEAQDLHPAVLEQLRLLTNLETNTRKLLQIILIGQPELQELLSQPELRQVTQRVVARYHLTHLTRPEVAAYVTHRLRIAGVQVPLFPETTVGTLYRLTGGVPRLINLVCDRALLGTYVQGKLLVTPATLHQAAREVFGTSRTRATWDRPGLQLLILAGLIAGGVAMGGFLAAPNGSFDTLFGSAFIPTTSPTHGQPQPTAETAPAPPELPPAVPAAVAAMAAPPEAAETPPLQNLAWPDEIAARNRSEGLAFQDLFKLYGVAYEARAKSAPCKSAEAVKMRCLYGRGGLSDLLRFNQPAVLVMDGGGKGKEYEVVLSALDGATATFLVAGETRHVPLSEIGPLWSGSYALLWRAPPGLQAMMLLEGSRGPAVAWLRQGIARLTGASADGPAFFDKDLTRQLKAFQVTEGMLPDGVAGPLTLIRLSIRLDDSLPRLNSRGGVN